MKGLRWLLGRARYEVNEFITPRAPVNFEFNEPECHVITEPVGTKLYVDEQTDSRVILAVDHAGKHWTIDVNIDAANDGGISAEIGRDHVLCTIAEFGWHDKHDNEPQEEAFNRAMRDEDEGIKQS